MKKIFLAVIVTLVFSVTFFVYKDKKVVTVNNNLNFNREIPKYVTKNIYNQNENVTIDINIPHTNSKKFNDIIEKIKDKYIGYLETGKNTDTKLCLNISYDVTYYKEDIISFCIKTNVFLGGAHPNSYIDTVTYDFKNEKEITAKEILENNLETISNICIEKLLEEEKIKKYYVESIFKEGTKPTLENYSKYMLDNNSVIFFFEKYSVAPYVAGEFSVVIPKENLNLKL